MLALSPLNFVTNRTRTEMKVAVINIPTHVSQDLPSSRLAGGLFKCKPVHKEIDEGWIPRACDRHTQNMDGENKADKLECTDVQRRKHEDWLKHSGRRR